MDGWIGWWDKFLVGLIRIHWTVLSVIVRVAGHHSKPFFVCASSALQFPVYGHYVTKM